MLKTRPQQVRVLCVFYLHLYPCVRFCEYKNSVLDFIHEIFIISNSKTPWLVYQGCTEGSVYKVLRSSATFVEDTKLRQIDSFVKKLYFSYFQLKVGDQDKSFAPHIACNTCFRRTALLAWRKVEGNAVCNTHAMARAEESLRWLLFLYGQQASFFP